MPPCFTTPSAGSAQREREKGVRSAQGRGEWVYARAGGSITPNGEARHVYEGEGESVLDRLPLSRVRRLSLQTALYAQRAPGLGAAFNACSGARVTNRQVARRTRPETRWCGICAHEVGGEVETVRRA